MPPLGASAPRCGVGEVMFGLSWVKVDGWRRREPTSLTLKFVFVCVEVAIMNLTHALHSPRDVQVTHATSEAVTVRTPDGDSRTYLATPVGWRQHCNRFRINGELVTDPALMALLDAAAASTESLS